MKGLNGLKPKLGTVIPSIDAELAELTVEKIMLSKSKRKMKLVLEAGASQYIMDRVAEAVKRECKLHEVYVTVAPKDAGTVKNTMIYTHIMDEDRVQGISVFNELM